MGAVLLFAVLLIKPLAGVMQAVALPLPMLLAVPGLAICSMLVIQILKAIRTKMKK